MTGGFSFPPPPPPPPKAAWSPPAAEERYASQDRARGRDRGRGRGRPHDSSGRGRGYGDPTPAQNYRHRHPESAESAPQLVDYARQLPSSVNPQPQILPSGSYINPAFVPRPNGGSPFANIPSISPPRTVAGHKRKLDALRPVLPHTAPVMPSFGAPILPPKPDTANIPKAGAVSTGRKSLGLAPADGNAVYSSSEDEREVENIDEEALHAELGAKLTFEHNGVVLTLNNAVDLAAWQDERRRNWPTNARMAERVMEKRKVGDERRRLLTTTVASKQDSAAAVRQVRREAAKAQRGSTSRSTALDRSTASKSPMSDLDRARKELVKQEAKLSALRKQVSTSQAALDDARARENTRNVTAHEESPDIELESETVIKDRESDVSSVLSESSVVSSGPLDPGSESDDDDLPEESTTKAPVTTTEQRGQRVCRYFAASGYCRDGDACGFRHELAPGARVSQPRQQQQPREDRAPRLDPVNTDRKSIYQRLMEQQQEEEDRLALKVIKHLGKAGFFSATTDA
ncbi:hypothetical protein LTS14_008113 [Recurvomyces mirabilis]|uniref:uncharacterized protein n=1 Tax=Recurvomyces mirabilis TaxID=574656 RepID=UPI002DDE183C|nr:hypothetical protein LTS14_008113 [Recurvomyces mirabilis]